MAESRQQSLLSLQSIPEGLSSEEEEGVREADASPNGGGTRGSRRMSGGTSGGTLMKVVADRSVTQLGFSPTGVPPETVSVALLQADGWAEQQGLAVGDVLYTVGMSAASELTKEEITRRLTKRPLKLTLLRPASKPEFENSNLEVQVDEILGKIAIAKRALRSAAVECTSIDAAFNGTPRRGSSADALREAVRHEEAGFETLAALAAVAGQLELLAPDAEELGREEQPEPKVEGGEETAEVDADNALTRCAEWLVKDDLPFTVEAPEGIRCLGFAVLGEPPDTVLVARVYPDGWAESMGIEANDTLLMLNESITSDLSKKDFVGYMKGRPLKLTLLRSYGETPPPPDLVLTATQLLGQALLDEDLDPSESDTRRYNYSRFV